MAAAPFRAATCARVVAGGGAGAARFEVLGLNLEAGAAVLELALRVARHSSGGGGGGGGGAAASTPPLALVALLAAQAVFGAFAGVIRATRTTFLGAGAGAAGGSVAISVRAVEALGLEPGAEDRLRRCAAAIERLEQLRALAEVAAGRRPPPGAAAEAAAGVAALVAAARGFSAGYDAWRVTL